MGLATLLATQSHAADHLDSFNTLATNPLGDINDVYTWMTTDTNKLNLAMTISPADTAARHFSDAVQYVFHVTSRGTMATDAVAHPGMGTETKVICTFASDTSAQCWVVSGTTVKDYVTGDPSATTGLTSADGKLKVFAGRRSDPFFFNLQGFRNAIKAVHDAAPGLPMAAYDAAFCPTGIPATATPPAPSVLALRTLLTTQQPTDANAMPQCPDTTPDCFATLDVKAIVLEVDKTLLNDGTNTMLAVWASTHAKP